VPAFTLVVTQQIVESEAQPMARSSFLSFHYQRDFWRVQQIRNIGALDNQQILPAQDWESVQAQGDAAVEKWIDKQMNYKAAVIVLIGAETSTRKFVKYEIRRAWQMKKPMLGIYINGLKDSNGKTDVKGRNPFDQFKFSDSPKTYADYVPCFTPTGVTSDQVYADIKNNLTYWIDQGYKTP
jgi:hypothetical protein